MEDQVRSIELGGRLIEFMLRRSSRRTLGMTVDRRGLTVTIPQRASLRETERFMLERQGWIIEKLDELAARPVPLQVGIRDGMQIPVLGEPCRVVWLAGGNRVRWVEGLGEREMQLLLRKVDHAREILLRGLQQYALQYFSGRVEEYVFLLSRKMPGVQVPPVRLTNARTRWGSCSRLSGIRLNWRLIHLPRVQIDYVVAHEVAHLLEMNHSDRFWQVVAQLQPGYEEAKARLRQANRIIPAL